jgi:hypothetical protein
MCRGSCCGRVWNDQRLLFGLHGTSQFKLAWKFVSVRFDQLLCVAQVQCGFLYQGCGACCISFLSVSHQGMLPCPVPPSNVPLVDNDVRTSFDCYCCGRRMNPAAVAPASEALLAPASIIGQLLHVSSSAGRRRFI